MRYLLDTDFVIDHLTGQQDARDTLAQLLPDGVAISIITFSEIYEGIYSSRDPRAAARAFTAFLTGVPCFRSANQWRSETPGSGSSFAERDDRSHTARWIS